MYGIFTYIYHKNQLDVGTYTSPMDGMGMILYDFLTSISDEMGIQFPISKL